MNRLSTTLLCTTLLFAYFGASGQNANTQGSPFPVSYSESESYSPRIFDPGSGNKTDKKKASKKEPAIGPASTVSIGTPVPNDTLVIPVAIYNNAGVYRRGLSAARFKAFVDDKQVEIVSVESKNEPVNIVLLLDMSPSTDAQSETIKNLAFKVIERLQPDDKITVVAFNYSVKIVGGPGADRELATKAIRKLRMGDGTSLYDAVWELFEKKLGNISGPTAMIIMTDGVDTTSSRASYQTSLFAAEKGSIPIFPVYFDTFKNIALKPAGAYAAEYELGKAYLTDILKLSGGRPVLASDVLAGKDAFTGIPSEVSTRYRIKIRMPQGSKAGERHQIKIRVDQPNLIILAKGSYIEP